MTAEPGVNDSSELRALVREVFPDGFPVTETVDLSTDEDLAAFVARLLDLEPGQRAELRSGRKRFRLAAPAASPARPQVGPAGGGRAGSPVRRIDTGAVTERMVSAAAQAGERLVLGRAAVLTPLARDRARATGVEIEKER